MVGLRVQKAGLTLQQMQRHVTTEYVDADTRVQFRGVSVAYSPAALRRTTTGIYAYDPKHAEVVMLRGSILAQIDEGWIIAPTEILLRVPLSEFLAADIDDPRFDPDNFAC